jgi:biopolymer transport protein ExbD
MSSNQPAEPRHYYGEIMEVMNLLRAAGYLKVALVGLDRATAP